MSAEFAVAKPGLFWRVWSAATASNLADGIRNAAFPLLAAAITRDPIAVGVVAAAQQLPWLVFGVIGGTWADRLENGSLVWMANAFRAAALFGLAWMVLAGAVTIASLVAIAILVGSAEAMVDSAYPGLVVATVDRERLEWANARLTASSILGNEMVGPALGSWLFAIGIALPIAVDGGLLAAAALFVLSLPPLTRSEPQGDSESRSTTFREDLIAGLLWLFRHQRLRSLTIAGGTLILLDTAWFAILVLFVLEELGMSETGFGLLLAAGAVGGLLGSAFVNRLAFWSTTSTRLVASLLVAGISQMVVGISYHIAVVAAMLAVSSGAFAIWNVTAATMRQREAPTSMLGRVSGTHNTLLIVAGGVGAVFGGVVASAAGLRAPMLIGGPILVITALLLRRSLTS